MEQFLVFLSTIFSCFFYRRHFFYTHIISLIAIISSHKNYDVIIFYFLCLFTIKQVNGFILEQEIFKRDSLLRLPTCDLREKIYLSEIHKSTDFITWRENFYDNLGTDREKKVGMFVPNTYFIIVLSRLEVSRVFCRHKII